MKKARRHNTGAQATGLHAGRNLQVIEILSDELKKFDRKIEKIIGNRPINKPS